MSSNNSGSNGNNDQQQQQQQQKSAMTAMGYFWAAREWATPTRKTSGFLEKGVLTPEEFVQAGDELVFRCPTWTWESGDPAKRKAYLPADKQFLMTRNVPCQTRVSSMEQQLDLQSEDVDGDGDEWLVSHILKENGGNLADAADPEDDFDILDEMGELVVSDGKDDDKKQSAKSTATATATNNLNGAGKQEAEEDEYADMADFEDDNVLADEDAAVNNAAAGAATASNKNHTNDNVIKVRTYDLSITYDKYYQTPRVWMVGKSALGQPLSGEEMMQDVITDYANKTVTIEAHPHTAGPHASIHPCQHGKVMKTIVRNLMSQATDREPAVEMYIFIFLKFVSSIIPTINYDFTMDVTASTQK